MYMRQWTESAFNNGLTPILHQVMISTNAESLSIGLLGTNFSDILMKIQNFFIHENAPENIVCEMAPILYGVKMS